VPLPVEAYGEGHREGFRQRFEAAYRQLYGRTIEGVEIEALSWTLTVTAPRSQVREKAAQGLAARTVDGAPVGHQQLFDPATARSVKAAVFLRDGLAVGTTVDGPALITEQQTTTVVPPAWRAHVADQGAIVLTRRESNNE